MKALARVSPSLEPLATVFFRRSAKRMKITSLIVRDIRFPTSLQQDGSDALNQGDYSAAYVVLVRYMPPQRAGYNIDIKPASIAEFESPSGRFWGARR